MKSSHLPPLRLLSLDGGGVRGLSSLIILQDIMEDISREEKKLNLREPTDRSVLRPCDYFDLIGGTSTGGIIAILLSRLRLDVPTCIKIYTSLAEKVFKNDRSITIMGLKLRYAQTRFSGAVLEMAIKTVLKDYGFDPEERMWDETLFGDSEEGFHEPVRISTDKLSKMEVLGDGRAREVVDGKGNRLSLGSTSATTTEPRLNGREQTGLDAPHQTEQEAARTSPAETMKPPGKGCHGLVVAVYKHAVGIPKLFLTSDPNDQTKIWEALRATSAAPMFFEEISFGSPKVTYMDGALGYNSPCIEIDNQAKNIWEGRSIGCVVSIGTGLQAIPNIPNKLSWLRSDVSVVSAIIQMATSTARVDNEAHRMYRDTETKYSRWDVDTGLGDISLEQWMKVDEMASASRRYMEDPTQQSRKNKLANTLARLSADPKVIQCSAGRFIVGLKGDGFTTRDPANPTVPCWLMENLDLKTGYPLGMSTYTKDERDKGRSIDGSVFPVEMDLDGDGYRSEAQVITCVRSDDTCLRTLIQSVPQGRYSVRFAVCLYSEDTGGHVDSPQIRNFHHAWPEAMKGISTPRRADQDPPINLIFSAGKPYDPLTFTSRYVDPVISADIVPVLLQSNAVRVRIDEEMWSHREGKGWFEIEGDSEIEVGLGGIVGIAVNKVFEKERRWIGGWSFGGVRLVPVREERRSSRAE